MVDPFGLVSRCSEVNGGVGHGGNRWCVSFGCVVYIYILDRLPTFDNK